MKQTATIFSVKRFAVHDGDALAELRQRLAVCRVADRMLALRVGDVGIVAIRHKPEAHERKLAFLRGLASGDRHRRERANSFDEKSA